MDLAWFSTGIYSVSDAARLTGVSAGRIRRWLRGYHYRAGDKQRALPPLWRGQWPPIHGNLALGFQDLIEIRFVDAFLKQGASWAAIHRARERAAELFQVSHPFCTNRFVTDGRQFFVQAEPEQPSLLEINSPQQVFTQIMKPFIRELEFKDGSGVIRWWPLGDDRAVVLDPERNFGRPITSPGAVPTEVIANAPNSARPEGLGQLAQWYEISEKEVRDAIAFETQPTGGRS
jgi:hypothetical protein